MPSPQSPTERPVYTVEECDRTLEIATAKHFDTAEDATDAGFSLIIPMQPDLDRKYGEMTQLQRFGRGYDEVGLVEHEYVGHYDVYGKRAEQPVRTGRLRRLLGGKAARG